MLSRSGETYRRPDTVCAMASAARPARTARERQMKRLPSAWQVPRFLSAHHQGNTLFNRRRHHLAAVQPRTARRGRSTSESRSAGGGLPPSESAASAASAWQRDGPGGRRWPVPTAGWTQGIGRVGVARCSRTVVWCASPGRIGQRTRRGLTQWPTSCCAISSDHNGQGSGSAELSLRDDNRVSARWHGLAGGWNAAWTIDTADTVQVGAGCSTLLWHSALCWLSAMPTAPVATPMGQPWSRVIRDHPEKSSARRVQRKGRELGRLAKDGISE